MKWITPTYRECQKCGSKFFGPCAQEVYNEHLYWCLKPKPKKPKKPRKAKVPYVDPRQLDMFPDKKGENRG